MQKLVIFALAVVFGFVLSRSGAADYNFIQKMFLFESFQLYGIIGTAVLVTAPGLWLLKRHGKAANGAPLAIAKKPRHKGQVVGGLLFGAGWAITGMCPGPVLVTLGEGKLYAWGALAGVVSGAYLLGWGYDLVRQPLGLPPVKVGTGNG